MTLLSGIAQKTVERMYRGMTYSTFNEPIGQVFIVGKLLIARDELNMAYFFSFESLKDLPVNCVHNKCICA